MNGNRQSVLTEDLAQPASLTRGVWKGRAPWTVWVGLVLVAVFIGMAVFADVLAPNPDVYWPTELSWEGDPHGYMPHPPDGQTILGTVAVRQKHEQMDVYSVLIRGSRSAVLFGLTAGIFTCLLGTLLGALSAAVGGLLDRLMMRITDAFLTMPVIVGVVVIQQLILVLKGYPSFGFMMIKEFQAGAEPGLISKLLMQINPVLLSIILFSWMPYARMTNTMVLRIKKELYVTAAQALGANRFSILFTHLLPNSLAPSVILLARDIGGFVLLQSALTFIGLGGESEWGALLAYARDWIIGPGGNLLTRWWVYLPITLALVLFGIGWNLLGDSINRILDPRGNS